MQILTAALLATLTLAPVGETSLTTSEATTTTKVATTNTMAYDTPRTSSKPVANIHSGRSYEAICYVQEDAKYWLKFEFGTDFGFAVATAFGGGAGGVDPC